MAVGGAAGAAAGLARGAASLAGGAVGAAQSGGAGGVAKAAGAAAISPLRKAAHSLHDRFEGARAAQAAPDAGGSPEPTPQAGETSTPAKDSAPPWARKMRTAQQAGHGASVALHAVNSGDAAGGGGSSIDLSEGS